jgi:hypothetical protein
MDQIKLNDICIYGPNDTNKNGKVGKTSWDSFSYAIMMGHNVWHHINAVQEANKQYDLGACPNMLINETHNRLFFKDIIEAVFATSDKGVALAVIDEFNSFWNRIIGTRGLSGKKATNANTKFTELFEVIEDPVVELEEDRTNLDALEIEIE